jgi:hypothetical protein
MLEQLSGAQVLDPGCAQFITTYYSYERDCRPATYIAEYMRVCLINMQWHREFLQFHDLLAKSMCSA